MDAEQAFNAKVKDDMLLDPDYDGVARDYFMTGFEAGQTAYRAFVGKILQQIWNAPLYGVSKREREIRQGIALEYFEAIRIQESGEE